MYQLHTFDGFLYSSYDAALKEDAVFSTTSTVDMICLDGPKSTICDLIEAIDVIRLASGGDDLVYGIIHKDRFIELKDIEAALNDETELTEALLEGLMS